MCVMCSQAYVFYLFVWNGLLNFRSKCLWATRKIVCCCCCCCSEFANGQHGFCSNRNLVLNVFFPNLLLAIANHFHIHPSIFWWWFDLDVFFSFFDHFSFCSSVSTVNAKKKLIILLIFFQMMMMMRLKNTVMCILCLFG